MFLANILEVLVVGRHTVNGHDGGAQIAQTSVAEHADVVVTVVARSSHHSHAVGSQLVGQGSNVVSLVVGSASEGHVDDVQSLVEGQLHTLSS